MSSLPLVRHQIFVLGGGFEDTRLIRTDVAIAMQPGIGNVTQLGTEGRGIVRITQSKALDKLTVVEQPDSPLTVRQRHHL